MARNGSGTYSLLAVTAPANTVSSSTTVNNNMNDIATALTESINKDGTKAWAANQSVGSNKFTSLADGSARSDSINMGQVQDGKANWVDGGGTADAITATYSPAITALVDGQLCYVRATAANTTTTPTFAPNGLTARTIVKTGGVALAVGDIVGDGHELILRYLLASTRWELLNPASVSGPTSATDNAIARFDGTTGKLVQDSAKVTLGDNGDLSISSAGYAEITNTNYAADNIGAGIAMSKSRHATPGSHTIVQDGDALGFVTFRGSDGAAFRDSAQIRAVVDGTPGSSDMPGSLSFRTTPDGSATMIEKFRITSGNNNYAYRNGAANPGQVLAEHWVKLTSNNTLADSTSSQPLFDGGGGSANGAITLGTGQYFFECLLYITGMSGSSGNGEFELAGAATLSEVLFHVSGIDSSTPLAAATQTGTGGDTVATNAASMLTAGTGTAMLATIRGTFNVTAAGTVIPSIDLVTGGVTPAVNTGSYFRCWRAGDTGSASIGAWS